MGRSCPAKDQPIANCMSGQPEEHPRRLNLKQPWLFVFYALGFGVLTFLFGHGSLPLSILGGLVFACFMTLSARWKRTQRPSRFET